MRAGVVLVLPAAVYRRRARLSVCRRGGILQYIGISAVDLFKGYGAVYIKDQQSARRDIQVQAGKAGVQVAVSAQVIDAVQTANGGVNRAVQFKGAHILAEEERCRHPGWQLVRSRFVQQPDRALGAFAERLGKHILTAVNADHVIPPIGKGEGHAPRSAGEIQHDARACGQEAVKARLQKGTPAPVVYLPVEAVVHACQRLIAAVHG